MDSRGFRFPKRVVADHDTELRSLSECARETAYIRAETQFGALAQAAPGQRRGMKRSGPVVLLLLLAGGAALYLHLQHPQGALTRWVEAVLSGGPPSRGPSPGMSAPPPLRVQEPPASSSQPTVAVTHASPVTTARPPVEVSLAPLPPTVSNLPPETVLENMRTVIRLYGSTFGGNPVGTNPEITSSLQGENPKHINFLKEDGNRVNSKGELVDLWGTPYFFHQLSAAEMEIRSAGPDRKMWTEDDLVIK